MDANTTTPLDNENEADNLLSEEEELSSGNGRLAIIVGVILAVVVLGYVLLPAQATRRLADVMPIMQLGEATVTGTREKEAPAAPTAAKEGAKEEASVAPAAAVKVVPTRVAAAPAPEAPQAAVEAEPIAIEPVPAAVAAEEAPANVTMTGRILDENGRPLAGATVMLKGSRKATGTDANGNYSLEVPTGDNTLVYGYGGYEDHEVRTRSAQPQNVTLTPREDGKRRRR